MAASDHLGPMFKGTLYHGTRAKLQPGDIVRPGGPNSGEGAYATDYDGYAANFGDVYEVEAPHDLHHSWTSEGDPTFKAYTSRAGFKVIKKVEY